MHPFVKLWRGDVPLSVAFWRYGGYFLIILAFFNFLAGFAEGWKLRSGYGGADQLSDEWHKIQGVSVLLYTPLLTVGIWKSSGVYSGPRHWKYLARATVILVALQLLGLAVGNLSMTPDEIRRLMTHTH